MGVLGIVGSASNGNTPGGEGFGRYEVKRSWQWNVDFQPMVSGSKISTLLTKEVRDALSIAARTITRPGVQFGKIEIPHANEKFFLIGKADWGADTPIEISFNDIIPNSAAAYADAGVTTGDTTALNSAYQILHDWAAIQQSPWTGAGTLAADYKTNIILNIFDPAGTVIERWVYHGAMLESFSSDGLDRSSDTPLTATATFQFDKAYKVQVTATTPPSTQEEAMTVDTELAQASPDPNA